jgi:hypothetical protein
LIGNAPVLATDTYNAPESYKYYLGVWFLELSVTNEVSMDRKVKLGPFWTFGRNAH